MGRPSKSTHPLAIARKHTGKTQKELAKLVGISPVTIQKIESGEMELSRSHAEKIGFTIGVEPASIYESSHPHPRALGSQEPYSKAVFQRWHSYFATNPDSKDLRVIQFAEVLKEEIEALLFASDVGLRGKLPRVLWALCQAVTQIKADLDLGDAVVSVRMGKGGAEDHVAYELGKEDAFLYRTSSNRSLRKAKVKGCRRASYNMTEDEKNALTQLARETRISMIKIVDYLSQQWT